MSKTLTLKGDAFSLTINGEPVPLFLDRSTPEPEQPYAALPELTGVFTAEWNPASEPVMPFLLAMQYGGLTYGSVCSGIEAATVAWHSLGWKPVWFAEIEKFPSAVLAHHWPDVPNLGDMTRIAEKVTAGDVPAMDVMAGGTPCQSFSLAGSGDSLDDERGQLTLKYVELANAIDNRRAVEGKHPTIFVWENVPGVLVSKDNAFGHFLAGLAGEPEPFTPGLRPEQGKSNAYWRWRKETGRHVPKWAKSGVVIGRKRQLAWRVLDAQYFGVAQRRRRVFVVASARKDIDPAKILFEFDGMRRDSAPCREPEEEITGTLSSRSTGGGGLGTDFDCNGGLQPVAFGGGNCSGELDVAACLTAKGQRNDFEVETFALAFPERMSGTQYASTDDVCPALMARNPTAVAFADGRKPDLLSEEADPDVTGLKMRVRRLMPVECERLQGFPDGHTDIPWNHKPAGQTPDAPRYKAIGNSMAVPVMRWIGERIGRAVAGAAAMPEPVGEGKQAPLRENKTRPFLKWAGGKFKVLDTLAAYLPAGKRLIEPFVGAGSVFLNLHYPRYLLADVNPDLINLYRQLESAPYEVIRTAQKLVANCISNSAYLALRDEFNSRQAHAMRHAALFLALNRTCWNGLSRYNAKGLFNVGWCKKETPYFPADELEAFVTGQQHREFVCASFLDTIAQAGEGDVIFCDPPYEPMPGKGGFTAYAKGAFKFDQQVLLADALVRAHQRGARAVITNSSARNVITLYESCGFAVDSFTARRSISRDATTRGDVSDIIAVL